MTRQQARERLTAAGPTCRKRAAGGPESVRGDGPAGETWHYRCKDGELWVKLWLASLDGRPTDSVLRHRAFDADPGPDGMAKIEARESKRAGAAEVEKAVRQQVT